MHDPRLGTGICLRFRKLAHRFSGGGRTPPRQARMPNATAWGSARCTPGKGLPGMSLVKPGRSAEICRRVLAAGVSQLPRQLGSEVEADVQAGRSRPSDFPHPARRRRAQIAAGNRPHQSGGANNARCRRRRQNTDPPPGSSPAGHPGGTTHPGTVHAQNNFVP